MEEEGKQLNEASSACLEREHALLRRNIMLIRVVRALRMCLFGIPVMVVYWQHNGVDVQGVLAIKAVHSISNVILEVPSGYCSDHIGRKPTLLIAVAFSGLYWLVVGLVSSKPAFAVCQVLLGVGDSFFSGTDTAVLYESMAALGLEAKALGSEAKTVAVAQVTESLASVAGGLIVYKVGLRAAIWLTCLPYVAAFIACGFIHEPELKVEAGAEKKSAAEAFRETYRGVVTDLKRREVAAPMMVGTFNAIASYMSVWLNQPLWERAGVPLKWFGIAWAGLNLNVSISAMFAEPVQRALGVRGALYLLAAWVAVTYLGLGLVTTPLVIGVGCALYWVRGCGGPIISTYLNSEIPASRRATVLSLKGLLYHVIFSAMSTMSGAVEHVGGLTWTCVVTGLVLGASMAGGLLWGGRGGGHGGKSGSGNFPLQVLDSGDIGSDDEGEGGDAELGAGEMTHRHHHHLPGTEEGEGGAGAGRAEGEEDERGESEGEEGEDVPLL